MNGGLTSFYFKGHRNFEGYTGEVTVEEKGLEKSPLVVGVKVQVVKE